MANVGKQIMNGTTPSHLTPTVASGLRVTLAEALDSAAARWPDQVGWIFDDTPVTFAMMQEHAETVASALFHAGVRKGGIVAVWLPNLLEFAACQFACARIGAILAAINTRSKLTELYHALSHSGAEVLVMVDTFLKHDFRATLLSICPELKNSGTQAKVAAFPRLARVVSLSTEADYATPWRVFLREPCNAPPVSFDAVNLQDPVLLQYTSGTTARPKGALLSHHYVTYLGAELIDQMEVRPGEAVLNTQPFYHIGGSCMAVSAPVITGCRMVVPPYYDPGTALSAIERNGCVARSGYGAMYIMEMAHPSFSREKTRSLRSGWCVGPPELLEEVRAAMGIPELLQIFGSTEANGTSGHTTDPWKKRFETCGRALPNTEMMIADPVDGSACPTGQQGEILMRGPYCMNGYLGQPEATAEVIDADGWVHTGDLGALDPDGYLYFRGRLKNMLKVGGENVSAEEVEHLLLQHPAIRQAAVFGMPDKRLQEVVYAAIEVKDEADLTERDVITYCAERTAKFRVPRHVRFVKEWPLTGSGKIQRHVIREAVLGERHQECMSP